MGEKLQRLLQPSFYPGPEQGPALVAALLRQAPEAGRSFCAAAAGCLGSFSGAFEPTTSNHLHTHIFILDPYELLSHLHSSFLLLDHAAFEVICRAPFAAGSLESLLTSPLTLSLFQIRINGSALSFRPFQYRQESGTCTQWHE